MDVSAASAGTANGCVYPRVCFYLTESRWNADNPTGSYQVLTSGYQDLGSDTEGSFAVWNTRNDDGALLHYTNGNTYCLPPNRGNAHIRGEIVDKIRIMDSPTCGR
ncbi:hypothetical protein [Micromonospora sp. LH3U1]|uniref:hypothetical protein n=1 Tax=Micromonospora sp. LH3U1 TaxID=3018339 RepID=UPI00234A5409|nr:hypothetical protein [Micromonospora sp. LH3U1]WCN83711.1 hypothetical protein PCA76_11960 [Micromonospora sp. LH3U1]